MTLTLTPAQEAFVESAVREGAYASVDDWFAAALSSLAQSRSRLPPRAPRLNGVRAMKLTELLSEEFWTGADLDITRDTSPGRDLDL